MCFPTTKTPLQSISFSSKNTTPPKVNMTWAVKAHCVLKTLYNVSRTCSAVNISEQPPKCHSVKDLKTHPQCGQKLCALRCCVSVLTPAIPRKSNVKTYSSETKQSNSICPKKQRWERDSLELEFPSRSTPALPQSLGSHQDIQYVLSITANIPALSGDSPAAVAFFTIHFVFSKSHIVNCGAHYCFSGGPRVSLNEQLKRVRCARTPNTNHFQKQTHPAPPGTRALADKNYINQTPTTPCLHTIKYSEAPGLELKIVSATRRHTEL